MKEVLQLPPEVAGRVWLYSARKHDLRSHHHDELELNLIVRGSGRYLIRDRRVDLRVGTLIWLFPEQEHLLIHQSRDLKMWIVVFKKELVDRVIQGANGVHADNWATLGEGAPIGSFSRDLLRPTWQRLTALYEEIQAQHSELAAHNAGLAYLLAASWSAHLRAAPITQGADVHPAVEKIAHAIHHHPGTENLEDLARGCGLSYSRLSRLFKAQTGVSLVQYRRSQRIENFLTIFGKGNRRTVTQAAFESGYGSYPQFHRDFTRIVGVNPASFRKSLHSES